MVVTLDFGLWALDSYSMSKQLKSMIASDIRKRLDGVQDALLVNVIGLNSSSTFNLRRELRSKNIQVLVVKNSLAKRVFGELGLTIDGIWEGPTILAWGTDSVAELSKAIDEVAKKNAKIKVKKAVAEGVEVTFEQALKMPTRLEAIGTILSMILGPARQIAGQIAGPAGQIAGQIKTIADKKPEEPAPAEAPADG